MLSRIYDNTVLDASRSVLHEDGNEWYMVQGEVNWVNKYCQNRREGGVKIITTGRQRLRAGMHGKTFKLCDTKFCSCFKLVGGRYIHNNARVESGLRRSMMCFSRYSKRINPVD
jgi:hypothetical protein